MPKVYVLNQSGHDFSDAERFGECIFVTKGTISPFNVNNMYRIFMDAFEDAEASDYILITSLTILGCVACSLFAHKFSRLNLLLFKDGKYVERRLVFETSAISGD